MVFGPTISAPIHWLALLFGRLFGRVQQKTPKKVEKRPKKRFFKLPRSLKITKPGKIYIVTLFLIGLAAINTGTNLLYMIVGMLLSLIIISGLLSESTLKQLTVSRSLPPHAFKDSPTPVRITVENTKQYFSSFSFTIKEDSKTEVTDLGGYVLKLEAGKEAKVIKRYIFSRRGLNKLTGINIKTAFPFGLFIKGRPLKIPGEILVYPAIEKLNEAQVLIEGDSQHGASTRKKGHGAEIYSLREHIAGDDARHIDWKATAREQRTLQREFETEIEKKVLILFDNLGEGGEVFEASVTEAATLANHLIERGYLVGLNTLTGKVAPEAGHAGLHSVLSTLALIEPAGPGEPQVRLLSI